ncbi:MAG TPA: DHHA1 domain-containing protein [Gemmatimonadales bacterium]
MTTERLYYTDSYLSRFTATVVHQDDGGRRIYLDRTAFYPTSGGQPHDTGRLGGVRVVEVVDEEDRIAHLLDAPLVATSVEGTVDWPRRFDHMQQHTGQHLVSAVLAELFGYQTVSVHFGAVCTLDLETGAITPEEIRRAETRANAIVFENRPVTIDFEDAGTAASLRKASGRKGALRIVTIADLDRSACGGTHVRATGEIGPILIRKAERVRKQVRLEFLCGARAVARTRADFEILSAMAASATAAFEDLPAVLERQRTDLKAAEAERRRLEETLAGFRAQALYGDTTPGASGRRCVIYRQTDGTLGSLATVARTIVGFSNVAFLATLTAPPTVLLATSADSGLDAAALLKPVLSAVGGRGGGSARLAQGTVPGTEAIETALAQLASAVRDSP